MFAGYGLALLCDAVIGHSILYKLFSGSRSNVEILEGFLTDEQK